MTKQKMDTSDFNSGKLVQQYEYKSFSPNSMNTEWVVSSGKLNTILSEANRLIGELNAFSILIPDIDFFLQMHVTKEATTSSRIEGTKTNIQEAFIHPNDIDPEKRDDQSEVNNYIRAVNEAIEALDKLPFSNRLLKNTHRTLLQGVRGKNKLPGEFRNSQNWIGASPKSAIFIPPHHKEVGNLMSDLELFLNNQEINVPHLIRIAIAHYQFETIHPFLDGNGRLGRLMISLYLVNTGLLFKPTLYLSDFFERNKGYYYDHLTSVRQTNKLNDWLMFFLEGVIETSRNSIATFRKIIALRERLESELLPTLGSHSKIKKGITLINYLYTKPVLKVNEVKQNLNFTYSTANRLLQDFVDLKILIESTGYKRNRMFVFQEYIEIFK